MQQQRHKPPTDEHCPNCGENNRQHWSAGKPPPFCMACRFPLLLIAGKYRLIRQIDEGGCGTVYEARHTQLSRDPKRAIKIIKPELMKREGMQARFRREVQVTGSLSQQNQHIVRIYDDFGEEPGLGYYYIMEFLKGQPVSEWLQEHDGRLPIDLACKLFAQLCDAMQDAHAEGIIHRDLKPENMFVVAKRRDPHFLKVIDFGIAKPIGMDDDMNLTAGALGTPAYMSPEQCTNSQITARTDIYAMGCILFELFAGFPPFSKETMGGRAPNMLEMLTFHVKQPPPRLTDYLPPARAVPEELADVIIKAMAKSPEDRYPNVEALERAFLAAEEEFDASTAIRPSPFLDTLPSSDMDPKAKELTLPYEDASGIDGPLPVALVQEALAKTQQDKQAAPTTPERKALPPSQPRQTTHISFPQPQKTRLFGTLVVLFLLSGISIWLYATPKKPTPAANKAAMPAHRQTEPTRRTPPSDAPGQAPAARQHTHKPGEARTSPPHRPSAPGIVATRRTVRRKRPRKRFAVLVRRIARRRKTVGRTVPGCPKTAGLYWLRLTMGRQLQTSLKWRNHGSKVRVLRKSWGLCVGAKHKGATLELYAPNLYHACRFRVWGRSKPSYGVHMTPEEEPNPNPIPTKPTNNCLK